MEAGELARATVDRYDKLFAEFCTYAAVREVTPQQVSPTVCRSYLYAYGSPGHPPNVSSARLRLAALRCTFRSLRAAGVLDGDPTEGLTVPRHNQPLGVWPLTPTEVRQLLSSPRLTTTDTLRPAVVAAALTGASHAEVAAIVLADFDSADGSLLLAQGKPRERRVPLDGVLLTSMRARAAVLRRSSSRAGSSFNPGELPLAMHRPVNQYQPGSIAPTVSMNLSRALARAGIHRVGVRPRSLREYAANRVYAQTGRVEDVARTLGLASLDAAFRLVDTQWQQRWGEVIRTAGPR